MRFPATTLRTLVLALIAGAPVLWTAHAQAQSTVLEIVSPVPGQMIGREELLIVVNVRDGNAIDPRSVELFVDDQDFTDEAKVSQQSIRFLLRNAAGRALTPGNHVARVVARLPDGTDLGNLEWQFVVDGLQRPTQAAVASKSGLPIRGSTYIGTRNSDISGNRSLRQEPESIYTVRTDLRAEYGAFTFPLKAYVTTNESSTSQPRNRFLVGAQSKHLTVLLGDTNPYYSPLALSNTRSRGLLTEVYFKPIRLSFTRGQIRRAVDVGPVSDPNVLASPLLNSYNRAMTAARISVGGKNSVLFSLHALKARDDTTSASFGTRPLENIVAGTDFEVNVLKGRFGAAAGSALSVTTEDISRGVADKAEIDSLFDVDIPFDPADIKRLIVLNTSTVPIRLDKLGSLAWYANAHGKAFGHSMTTEYRSIGASFYSAGNPFLINDRRILTISDRFRHLEGRLFGSLRYSRYHNFAGGEFTIPLSNLSWSGNVSFSPRGRAPTTSLGYRRQERSRGTAELPLSDSKLDSYSIGLSKQFKVGTNRHTVQVLASRSTRSDEIQPQLDNLSLTTTLGFIDQFSRNVSTNVRLTRVSVEYGNLDDRQIFQTATGDVAYQLVSMPLDLRTGLRYTHAGGSSLVSSSNRYGFSVAGEYEIQQNMLIELQLGVDSFRDVEFVEARYTERYVTLRHRYTF